VKRSQRALSFEDVVELRELCETHPQRRVAMLFGIAASTVSRVRRGLSWRVDRPVKPAPYFHNVKLSPADIEDIRRLAGHLRTGELARMFKVHRTTIWKITTGRTWRDLP
jgi:hypothetical protein